MFTPGFPEGTGAKIKVCAIQVRLTNCHKQKENPEMNFRLDYHQNIKYL